MLQYRLSFMTVYKKMQTDAEKWWTVVRMEKQETEKLKLTDLSNPNYYRQVA